MADGTPITALHIGTAHTLIVITRGAAPDTRLSLAIGSRRTASDHFKHHPPTPGEWENAIQAIEDEVVRARAITTAHSTLMTTDMGLRDIALLAGVPAGPAMTLAVDDVERLFARFAAISLGRPAAQDELPDDANLVATLLILREFMHHLQFSSISIKV